MRTAGIVFASVAGAALVAVVAAGAIIVLGVYDFGADTAHTAGVTKLIEFARERSVDVRASGINVPPLGNRAMLAEGAEHYGAICTGATWHRACGKTKCGRE